VQLPSGAQQAPGGCGQEFGLQRVNSECQMFGLAQLSEVVRVQLPSGAQHAPSGSSQGFVGVQVVQAPSQVPEASTQSASVSSEQTPPPRQQAPVG